MIAKIEYLADYPEFIPQIATWYFTEWGHKQLDNSIERTCAGLRSKLNRGRAPIPIIALAGGKLIGAAQLKIREMDIYPDREFWFGALYVDSTARRQGVGELLAKRIESISKQLGIAELFLQTERLDGGLYAKIGWRLIEHIHYDGAQVAVMCKQL